MAVEEVHVVGLEWTPTIFSPEGEMVGSSDFPEKLFVLRRGVIAVFSDGSRRKLEHSSIVGYFSKGSEFDHDEVITTISPEDFTPVKNYLKRLKFLDFVDRMPQKPNQISRI